MLWEVIRGLLIPVCGTAAGAAGALLPGLNGQRNAGLYRALMAFSAGVMFAASVWSLLLPATEEALAAGLGRLAFLPPVAGMTVGAFAFLLAERLLPPPGKGPAEPGPAEPGPAEPGAERSARGGAGQPLMILAIVLHNIPEGVALGIVYAGLLAGEGVSSAAALALSVGIAIQNIPDGAIIAMPLAAWGTPRGRAFAAGAASGLVEPLAALVTLAGAELILPAMPVLLAFAAGAMVYVVVDDLFPEICADGGTARGTLAFMLGFALMMMLDIALG